MDKLPLPPPLQYELRYRSLRKKECVYAFPCDSQGHVDMNGLGPRRLNDYLFARALVGRDLSVPSVAAA